MLLAAFFPRREASDELCVAKDQIWLVDRLSWHVLGSQVWTAEKRAPNWDGTREHCTALGGQLEWSDGFNTWVGFLDLVLFVVLVLLLDLNNNTRVFALSWHVGFVMLFLDPRVDFQSQSSLTAS